MALLKFSTCIALIAIVSCSCFINNKNKGSISGINVIMKHPIVTPDGDLVAHSTDTMSKIYYYKDQVMYHSVYWFDSYLKDKLQKEGIRDYYLVYTKGDKKAYRFEPMLGDTVSEVKTDSALLTEGVNTNHFGEVFSERLTEVYRKEFGDSISSSYTAENKKDAQGLRMGMDFTGWAANFEYSLSSVADSLYGKKGMKLSHIKISIESPLQSSNNKTLDPFIVEWWVTKTVINDEARLLRYFNRAKALSLKNK